MANVFSIDFLIFLAVFLILYGLVPYRAKRYVLLLGSVPSALALQGFEPIRVNGNLRLAVYSAPSTSSWRGANGKAMCNTNGDVFAAGREGGWVLIAVGVVSCGGMGVGYRSLRFDCRFTGSLTTGRSCFVLIASRICCRSWIFTLTSTLISSIGFILLEL